MPQNDLNIFNLNFHEQGLNQTNNIVLNTARPGYTNSFQ